MLGLIQTYLDHLTVERGMSQHTVGAYGRDLRRYASYLAEQGITDPSQVTSAMIGSYAARLREGVAAPDGAGWIEQPLANASAARALIAVRSLHRFATAEGITAEDPARAIRPPKPPRRLPKALSLEQVQAMLAVPATDTEVGLRDAALWNCSTAPAYGSPRRSRSMWTTLVGSSGRRLASRHQDCGFSAKEAKSASCRSARTHGRRWMPTWYEAGPGSPDMAAAFRHCS